VIPLAIINAQLSELHSNYDIFDNVFANAFPLPPGSTPIAKLSLTFSQSDLLYKALIAS
jgi:hypothetical protein